MAKKNNTLANKIALTGERQYTQAMRNITSILKEQRSAVKAAAAEYDAADESTRDLSAQEEALSRVYETLQEKVRLAAEELDRLVEKTGEQSQESLKVRTTLNNARAEMARTGAQLKALRGQMDDAADGTQDVETGLEGIGQSAEEAQAKAKDLADQLLDVVGEKVLSFSVAGSVTGALAAAGNAGFNAWNDEKQSQNQLSAMTGLYGEELERVMNSALQVYSTGKGENMGDVTDAVATLYQITGLTGDALTQATENAIGLRDVMGMDVGETARSVAALMRTFGTDAQEAFDLITVGAQRGANKNGDLLNVIEEYSPFFASSGKSANEFVGTLVRGAEAGIFSVDKIGDAWKEFTNRLKSDEGAKEALEELGFAADDIVRKFAQGGETADLASGVIVTALAGVEDQYDQNRIGTALFASQWEDVQGRILPVFAGMEQGLSDVEGATQRLLDVKYDDLGTEFTETTRRITQGLGEIFAPFGEAAKDALSVLNDNIKEEGGSVFSGLMTTIGQANEQAATGAAQAFDDARVSYNEWAMNLATDIASGQWIQRLKEQNEAAQEEAQTVTETVEDQRTVLNEKLAAINQDITDADIAGNYAEAASLMSQRDQIIEDIASLATEVTESYSAMGESAAGALESQGPEMQTAADSVASEAVTAFDEKQPDMLDAGDELGSAGVIGTQAGLVGMADAGTNGADGAVGGMRTGISGAYSAGYEMGKAFERGYKAAQRIASPSREMAEAAQYSLDGLFEPMDAGVQQIYARGAALADALRDGYAQNASTGGSAGAGIGAQAWDDGLTMAIAQAVREAVSDLVFVANGETLGRVSALGASREISRMGKSTLAGKINGKKGW